jgi:hypothetical protein
MNFLEMNMAAPKLSIVPEGEYRLKILSATPHEGKDSGKPSLKIQFKVVGEPTAIDIMHYQGMPAPGDDADEVLKKINRVRDLLDTFKIPYTDNGFDIATFAGSEGYATLKTRIGQNGEENQIGRFLVQK